MYYNVKTSFNFFIFLFLNKFKNKKKNLSHIGDLNI